ncbi:MAG TPA: RDD family protein [Methylotenera sp.]|nr:RDD family protein [Methylotenera sp.]
MQDKPTVQIKVPATPILELKTPLLKLGLSLIYETLVIVALLFLCGLVFLLTAGDASNGVKRYALQLFLWLSIGIYFVWCWHKSGQTLAMHTWRLKLVTQNNHSLSLNIAIARYVLASISLMLFGFGFLWAIVDPDRLFLHDRLLKTKIIAVQRNTA